MTAVPSTHKMGRRRKDRRHAGTEDVLGLLLAMAFLMLIVVSLALLPFLPWGALSTLVCTGVVSVVIGRRMTHHTGDRHWTEISSPSNSLREPEDVVEPTLIITSPQTGETLRLAKPRHAGPSLRQKLSWGFWAVLALIWLRNLRDRYDTEAVDSSREEGPVSISELPGAGMGSPGVRL